MPLPPSTSPPLASDKDCTICHGPLPVPSGKHGQASELIEDVEFRCKHRVHWSCILEQSISSEDIRRCCPLCGQSVLNSQGKFMVRVRTECGAITALNFGGEIDEYLRYTASLTRQLQIAERPLTVSQANPERERGFIFLSLMSQMEFEEAELYLKGEDLDANGKLDPDVSYNGGGMTAMHMAALNDDVEGIQLLLKYGANKDLKLEDGQAALDMAKEVNAKKVIALLTAE